MNIFNLPSKRKEYELLKRNKCLLPYIDLLLQYFEISQTLVEQLSKHHQEAFKLQSKTKKKRKLSKKKELEDILGKETSDNSSSDESMDLMEKVPPPRKKRKIQLQITKFLKQ